MITFSIVYCVLAIPLAAIGTSPCKTVAAGRLFGEEMRYLLWGLVPIWVLALACGDLRL